MRWLLTVETIVEKNVRLKGANFDTNLGLCEFSVILIARSLETMS